jgi:hypothetical protein
MYQRKPKVLQAEYSQDVPLKDISIELKDDKVFRLNIFDDDVLSVVLNRASYYADCKIDYIDFKAGKLEHVQRAIAELNLEVKEIVGRLPPKDPSELVKQFRARKH